MSDCFKASMPIVLSIAGSDNTGGAGIQADIKTCVACNVYPATVITAITAQNQKGLLSIKYVGDEMLEDQLKTLYECLSPDAVKIGILPNVNAIRIIRDFLKDRNQKNIILDTVISASSGGYFSEKEIDQTIKAIKEDLFPLTSLITPNIPELIRIADTGSDDLTACIRKLFNKYQIKNILLKGGHKEGSECIDTLYESDGSITSYTSKRINSPHTHGTGCTLSTAIACGLAKGLSLCESISEAKNIVTNAILRGLKMPVYPEYGPIHPVSLEEDDILN